MRRLAKLPTLGLLTKSPTEPAVVGGVCSSPAILAAFEKSRIYSRSIGWPISSPCRRIRTTPAIGVRTQERRCTKVLDDRSYLLARWLTARG